MVDEAREFYRDDWKWISYDLYPEHANPPTTEATTITVNSTTTGEPTQTPTAPTSTPADPSPTEPNFGRQLRSGAGPVTIFIFSVLWAACLSS
jgi:hypothetical protein